MPEKKFPITLHGLDDHGVNVLLAAPTAWTPTVATLGFGEQIEISEEVYALNKDRMGDSWMDDLTPDAQIRRWGRIRVGAGPTPAHVQVELAERRHAALRREKQALIAANPRLRKQSGALMRLEQINAEIGG